MKNIHLLSISFLFITLLSSCIKDNFDAPDTSCLDQGSAITDIISIQDLKQNYNNSFVDQEIYVKAQVTASDKSGNIYKEFYVHDGTAPLKVSVDATNNAAIYPVGRYVYIKLNGLFVYDGAIGIAKDGNFVKRIPASLIEDYIIRGACDTPMAPLELDLASISGVESGTLIKLSGVEFEDGLDGITYANAQTQQSENRYIQDCNGNSIIVRNSGFSTFAGALLPPGNGTIVGIYAPYGNTPQILIRDTTDVDMKDVRCDGSSPNQNIILAKDFEDGDINSGGWIVQTPVGSTNWETSDIFAEQGTFYAKASNYSGGSNSVAETWLVSPSIDVSGETNPKFSFINAFRFDGAPMEVLISTDYDGLSDPNDATWNDLNPTLSPGDFDWVTSTTDLDLYQTSPFYIAFKYTGSASDGSTWEVDAIKIVAD